MSTPSTATPASTPKDVEFDPVEWAQKRLKPFTAPYYLVVASVLGAITTVFLIITVLLILIAANFNVLSLIE